jgi:hypothetical protein
MPAKEKYGKLIGEEVSTKTESTKPKKHVGFDLLPSPQEPHLP